MPGHPSPPAASFIKQGGYPSTPDNLDARKREVPALDSLGWVVSEHTHLATIAGGGTLSQTALPPVTGLTGLGWFLPGPHKVRLLSDVGDLTRAPRRALSIPTVNSTLMEQHSLSTCSGLELCWGHSSDQDSTAVPSWGSQSSGGAGTGQTREPREAQHCRSQGLSQVQ